MSELNEGMRVIGVVPGAPARPASGHKGTFGTVIVVGGREVMIGAAALVATGALRAGAGLAKVACPRGIVSAVLSLEPSATAIDWWNGESGEASGLMRDDQVMDAGLLAGAMDRGDEKRRAVLAVGPGLGVGDAARAVVAWAVRGERRLVLDADGLTALAGARGALKREGEWVMTPHPGEYVRLAQAFELGGELSGIDAAVDEAVRPAAARALARASGAVVVLKGQHTIVADADSIYTNHTGNPAMATAGTGDVLTGMIASFWAQGMSAREAAILAVYLHGKAGDAWASKHGRSGLLARELAAAIPDVMREHRGV